MESRISIHILLQLHIAFQYNQLIPLFMFSICVRFSALVTEKLFIWSREKKNRRYVDTEQFRELNE